MPELYISTLHHHDLSASQFRAASRFESVFLHHHAPRDPSFLLIYLVCISVKERLQTRDNFQGIA